MTGRRELSWCTGFSAARHGLGMRLGMILVYPVQWSVAIRGVHGPNRVLDVLTPLSDCRHETLEKIIGRENFGGFVYVLDGFPQHVFVLRVFMCPTNITLFCLYFVSLFPATTPRVTTPHTYHHGLSHLCIHPGYHTKAITLHQYTYIGLSHPLFVIRIL